MKNKLWCTSFCEFLEILLKKYICIYKKGKSFTSVSVYDTEYVIHSFWTQKVYLENFLLFIFFLYVKFLSIPTVVKFSFFSQYMHVIFNPKMVWHIYFNACVIQFFFPFFLYSFSFFFFPLPPSYVHCSVCHQQVHFSLGPEY